MTFIHSPSWDDQLLNKDMIIHILIQNPKHLLHIVCVSVRLTLACLLVTLSPGSFLRGSESSETVIPAWGGKLSYPRDRGKKLTSSRPAQAT